jgi:PAB-dependent poly(A)-specific ribonuclease subunit 3
MDAFIDGDEALGMSSGAHNHNTSAMVDQATAMFRSVQPFGNPSSSQVGTYRPTRDLMPGSDSFMSGDPRVQQKMAPLRSSDSGRGRGGQAPRGRGRGRGRGVAGPGVSRPAISTFMVNQGMRKLIGQFASETLTYTLQQHNYLSTMQLDEETRTELSIPETIQSYHSICPLENFGPSTQQPSRVLSIPTLAMKAIHHGDGGSYMLRRLDGRHVVPTSELLERAKEMVITWGMVANHSNVVGLREVFVSEEMMDTPSLFISSDYHPGACTLEQLYIKPNQGTQKTVLEEEELWSFLVQMTSALRAIHTAGLHVGVAAMHPSKVLVCSPNRIRFGFLGVAEILLGQTTDIPTAHLVDLSAMGSLILTLACAAKNEPPSLDSLIAYYSRDLCHIVAGLVAAHKGHGFKTWRNLAAALGPRVFDELDTNHGRIDTLTNELGKEIENGRVARFLIKLNMVVERSELFGDTRWSETGDRYLLKLFRDFVFHQIDEHGNPTNDWGVVMDAINKADAGVNEKIMLLSRDETSMLVVSYADIKRCLVAAYEEIKRGASRSE